LNWSVAFREFLKPMEGSEVAMTLRNIIRRFHPEGIPWPGSCLYDAVSRTPIFARHYQLVAEDVTRYCNRGRILDVGTGPGWLLLALQRALPEARSVGVDISAAMVNRARRNVQEAGCAGLIGVQAAAAGALPFPDGSFDTVVSTGSLHHWKDPVSALNEIHRVLKAGRYALIYDLVRSLPRAVAEDVQRRFGRVRLTLLWLHSFEEPFYSAAELERLAAATLFCSGRTRFVGALCCLILQKQDAAPSDHPSQNPSVLLHGK
jgi:SAM-dependent methyltransferase